MAAVGDVGTSTSRNRFGFWVFEFWVPPIAVGFRGSSDLDSPFIILDRPSNLRPFSAAQPSGDHLPNLHQLPHLRAPSPSTPDFAPSGSANPPPAPLSTVCLCPLLPPPLLAPSLLPLTSPPAPSPPAPSPLAPFPAPSPLPIQVDLSPYPHVQAYMKR